MNILGKIIKTLPSFSSINSVFYVLILLAIILPANAAAQGIARGYFTQDSDLTNGMAVVISATDSDKTYVERATRDNIQNVIGFTTTNENNLLTIGSAQQEVYVQRTGQVSALASDINGPIKQGDKLTLSPLKGVLMRADDVNPTLGTALTDLSLVNGESQTVVTDNGQKNTSLNNLNIAIDTTLIGQQTAVANDKSALERLGEAIVGKEVGYLQVIAAMIIFLIIMVAEGSIIYGAVSTGIISIGRNPMAKKTIRRELVRILGIAVFVLVIGMSAMYLILSL